MSTTALVLWALLALVLLVLITAATRPDSFRIERSTRIKGSGVQVLVVLEDFHRWAEWSPWEQIDPTLQRSYSGAASGKGAIYDWTGTGKAGTGRMEIREVEANRLLIQLDFFKPFKANNMAEFTWTTNGDTTQLNWAMFGPSPFISKLMGLVFNMDKLVGKDFEKGLENLRSIVEA